MTTDNIELIAAYFTVAGDVYPFGPSQISPFPFRDRVEAVARAGWKGIGMIPDDVDATAAKIGHAETATMMAKNSASMANFQLFSLAK